MSEKSSDSIPPPAASFPPGWNDPPKMGYAEQATPSPNRTKLNLNKRVAFPMSGQGSPGGGQKVELAASGLPMPFAKVSTVSTKVEPSGSIPVPNSSSSATAPPPCSPSNRTLCENPHPTEECPEAEISETKMREVLRNLDGLAKKIDDKKVQEEVVRRMDLLRVQTNKNQLCDTIKRHLVKICEALEEENFTEANQLHRSLMVDFHADCSAWGSSLRNIILAAQPQDFAIKPQE